MRRALWLIPLLLLGVLCAFYRLSTPAVSETREEIKKPASKPVLPSIKTVTAKSLTVKTDTETEFAELVVKAKESLPLTESIQKMSGGEMHHGVRAGLQIGESFGALHDFLKQHPEFMRQGLSFYHQCATDEKILYSVRAVCLGDLIHKSRRYGYEYLVRPQDYDKALWNHASTNPEIN